MERETEGKRRRGRRCKQILDDLPDKIRYWTLKEVLWRSHFQRDYGLVKR